MDKLYIVIPAYNESANIAAVIDEWYPIVVKTGRESRLVVVDDGSRDNTFSIISQYAQTRDQLIPIQKKNEGHGATVLFAYHYALKAGADYIFQTDSDGQTVPNEFWVFWEMRDQYDMVIGYRKGREDGFSRLVVTKVLKLVIAVSFGVVVTDANTPFRLMKAETLKETLELIPDKFNLSNVLISVIYAKKNRKVMSIPISFHARREGTNSIYLPQIIRIGIQAVKDFRQISKQLKL